MVDLQRIKTRVKIIAKSLGGLIVRHHTLTCHSLDVHVPIRCPKDYEFSCSSSPATPASHVIRSRRRYYPCSFYYYNHCNHTRVHHALPVGPVMKPRTRRNPLGRKVGLDDPLNLKPFMNCVDGIGDGCKSKIGSCVDRKAEEFIERFYEELRLQKLYFP